MGIKYYFCVLDVIISSSKILLHFDCEPNRQKLLSHYVFVSAFTFMDTI